MTPCDTAALCRQITPANKHIPAYFIRLPHVVLLPHISVLGHNSMAVTEAADFVGSSASNAQRSPYPNTDSHHHHLKRVYCANHTPVGGVDVHCPDEAKYTCSRCHLVNVSFL